MILRINASIGVFEMFRTQFASLRDAHGYQISGIISETFKKFLLNCLEQEIGLSGIVLLFGREPANETALVSVGTRFSIAILSAQIALKGGIENNMISCHNFSRQKREANLQAKWTFSLYQPISW